MALQTTGSAGLSDEMKTFYDRVLLERTVPQLVFMKFGQRRNIPKNSGKTIEFRRFESLAAATTPLTEGTPPTLKDLTVSAVTATIAQYGDAVGFSDLVSTTTIDPILTETAEILGDQAAETLDRLMQAVLVGGTVIQLAGGVAGRSSIAATNVLSPDEIRLAVLELKLGRAKRIDGFYQALVHPRATHDLMDTTEWREANQFAGSQRIFDGSLGTLYGVKFWESDIAPVLADAGATSTVDVFQTIIMGANAWGRVNLAGHNLRQIYKPLGSAGTADPVDQQQSMGWKVAFVAKILNDSFMIRIEHATSTADNA